MEFPLRWGQLAEGADWGVTSGRAQCTNSDGYAHHVHMDIYGHCSDGKEQGTVAYIYPLVPNMFSIADNDRHVPRAVSSTNPAIVIVETQSALEVLYFDHKMSPMTGPLKAASRWYIRFRFSSESSVVLLKSARAVDADIAQCGQT